MRLPASPVAALVAAALLACTPTAPGPGAPLVVAEDPAEPPGEVLDVALCRPGSLLPPDNLELCGSELLAQLWTPLVIVEPDGDAVPALAESVEQLDARTWAIALRDGWTFHDGAEVTAQGVADSWAAAAGGGYATSSYLSPLAGWEDVAGGVADALAGVEVVDDLRLRVRLDRPFSQLPLLLAFNPFFPLTPASAGDRASAAGVGTGPWRLADQGLETLTLERWAGYAGPAPQVGSVRYHLVDDEAQAWTLFEAGEVDVAPAPVGEWDRLAGQGAFTPAASATVEYLVVPLEGELADARVRRALSLAIDRTALAEEARGGAARPATGFVAPAAGGRDALCDVCRFDPEQARALLDATGMDLPAISLDGGDTALLEAVAAGWREELRLDVTVGGGTGDGMTLALWLMDYPSPQNFLEPLFGSAGAVNANGYANADFDALVAQGDAAATPEDATAAYRRAEDLLLGDLPGIPLLFPTTGFAHQGPVTRLVVDRSGQVALRHVELG